MEYFGLIIYIYNVKTLALLADAKVQCVGQYYHNKVLLNVVKNMITLMLLKHQTNMFSKQKYFKSNVTSNSFYDFTVTVYNLSHQHLCFTSGCIKLMF